MSREERAEVISLKEIRFDLAEFFRQLNAGRKFIVYQRATPIAVVGRVGKTENAKVLQRQPSHSQNSGQVSMLYDLLYDAHREMRDYALQKKVV